MNMNMSDCQDYGYFLQYGSKLISITKLINNSQIPSYTEYKFSMSFGTIFIKNIH